MKIIFKHKFLVGLLILLVLIGYYGFGRLNGGATETRYVVAAVERGTLVSSVSGSGQISVSNQVDLKPKTSGDVILIAVDEGQRVAVGALIVGLDSRDAQKTVRDAETSLESAKISLEKLKQPADALSLIQAQNAISQAQQSKQSAQEDLKKAYDDGYTAVASSFIDLPGVVTGLNNILNTATVNGNQNNATAYYDLIKNYNQNADQFRDAALNGYQAARTAYDKTLQDYKNASRYSSSTVIDSLITETYETTKTISEAIKNTKNFLDLVSDTLTNSAPNTRQPALLSTHQNSLQSYTGTVNTHISGLLDISNSIKNDKETITGSDRTIAEKTEALAKLKAGTDPLDIESQQLAIQQKENALLDAKEALANYSVRAPFSGVVAKINVKKGDPASSGTALATLITTQKIATVSLNEVDVAKIKTGQKATLTLDAFPGLTITGAVAQIDTIGTVAQGVVTYSVKIAFDTQDERVKPGMSVSAAIITDMKQGVLLVPNNAVKSRGSARYVQVADMTQVSSTQANANSSQGVVLLVPPVQRTVGVGISNNTMTEISNGLKEGDFVVVRTVSTSSQSQPQQQGGGFRIPGLGGGR